MSAAREAAEKAMQEHGLSVASVFIPYSQSRNKAAGWQSLNWRVTLLRNGREVVTTEYGAGIAHCPSYKNPPTFPGGKVDTYNRGRQIAEEIETGRACAGFYESIGAVKRGAKIEPDACDVVNSLILDAGVIYCGSFEDWASEYGYDTDSRKAEAIYRACLELALKMRAGLGDACMASLRDAFADY